MKRQPRILAGTALGLLMASAPLGAFPLQGSAAFDPPQSTATPLIPVQSNCPEGESAEGCAPQAEPEQKPRKKRERQAEQAAPSGEEQQGGQRRKREQQQQEAEQAAPASEEQPEPRRKKREQQQQEAEQAAPASDEQPEPRRKKRDRQQQEEAAPAERPAEQAAPASDEQPEPRRKKREREQQKEAAPAEKPAEQAAPASDEQPEPRRKKRDRQQQQEAEQAAPRENAAPANDNEQVTPRRKKREQDQQIEAAPSEQPGRKEAGEQDEPLPTDQQTAPAEGEKPRDQAKDRRKKPIGEQPVTGEQPSTGEQPAEREQAAPAEGEGPAQGEAPVFDSQKDAVRKRRGGRDNAQETGGQDAAGQPTQQNGEQAEAPRPAPVEQGPPPTDDRSAQQAIKLERMVRATEEKGRRVERAPDEENIRRRRERPRGVDVVRELGDRVILQFNNQTIVESDDAPRMRRGARNVYYEELSSNRTREIVERDNGIQIVTIRNRYGDVVQRSRIAPDGREYVLSYVDERHYEDDGDWRDPGDDLPPIRIDIPREEYILDSEEVEDPEDYYAFLEQPPVERVQRLYSIDEVKRSARVRDIARRIDLDTLNFEFGSASIPETEVQKLEGVASAMEKLLEKNPAETFLIEGHTDAVGKPEANLALSDRRAEAVAEALSNAFSIPPENLTTQGYGEEYLKVDTSEPERENRRVAIRRITSLVAPVASAN
ncbi:OmpA family protein [Mesorhizobium sp.]|uniref:OmpA family protein n=1 Tax=Mesorhizobium sp. TaxID=1871066 RepID=UPI000FE35FE5|nr:OmpA family protein [Mesorhizobium sp.]RWN51458.1 MAG: flagellar motor protein MotB [Mesorhizobium sp.]RWN72810.1 MAG: flagellar motor protein MotB [Mesorhizobium sp.]RWN73117.1 MAG: flagellar motor protein MotB [Mesorhizobium sp.]RWN85227.1 MAG: flagellar motor protein MotB [Mesorhizobium sp.]RWO08170.1 MAG: flagellar motor protein MotB [Mesorhizobium sp.]